MKPAIEQEMSIRFTQKAIELARTSKVDGDGTPFAESSTFHEASASLTLDVFTTGARVEGRTVVELRPEIGANFELRVLDAEGKSHFFSKPKEIRVIGYENSAGHLLCRMARRLRDILLGSGFGPDLV